MPVPVDPKLLEILACPACKKPVQLIPEGTGLLCAECHLIFPIENDIPVMLVDEARPDDESRESH
ncbi:MAG: Trm112 family protein [Acidobacteria bacterium]|nr:Trm112 family protein [Acidobacteriota bacterium]